MYHDRVGDDDKPALEFDQLVLALAGTTVLCLLLARVIGFGWFAAVGIAYLGGAALTLLVAAIVVARAKPARGAGDGPAMALHHDGTGRACLVHGAGSLAQSGRTLGQRA